MKYDIYINDNGDDTFNIVVRNNEKLKAGEDYTISYYDLDKTSMNLIRKKYNKQCNYYLTTERA